MERAKGAEYSVLRMIASMGTRGGTVRDIVQALTGGYSGSASAARNVKVVMERLVARGWIKGTGIATFYVTEDGYEALGEGDE